MKEFLEALKQRPQIYNVDNTVWGVPLYVSPTTSLLSLPFANEKTDDEWFNDRMVMNDVLFRSYTKIPLSEYKLAPKESGTYILFYKHENMIYPIYGGCVSGKRQKISSRLKTHFFNIKNSKLSVDDMYFIYHKGKSVAKGIEDHFIDHYKLGWPNGINGTGFGQNPAHDSTRQGRKKPSVWQLQFCEIVELTMTNSMEEFFLET